MKQVLVFAAIAAALAGAIVWRTQHGPEVWHSLPDRRADVPS